MVAATGMIVVTATAERAADAIGMTVAVAVAAAVGSKKHHQHDFKFMKIQNFNVFLLQKYVLKVLNTLLLFFIFCIFSKFQVLTEVAVRAVGMMTAARAAVEKNTN